MQLEFQKKKENGTKGIFEEIMTEKFPKLIEEIKPCIQEVLWILSRINMKEKKYLGKS